MIVKKNWQGCEVDEYGEVEADSGQGVSLRRRMPLLKKKNKLKGDTAARWVTI